MSSIEITEHIGDGKLYKRYIPERDYRSTGYKPFGKGFDDLCGHCEVYYQLIHAKGLTKKPFMPVCNKHVLDEFKTLKAEDFASPEEYEELMINADPVAWAVKNFAWEARWYQEEMMSCWSGSTHVFLSDGSLCQIQDIKVGDSVLTYDETGRRTFPKKVTHWINNGVRKVYRITLENGDKLECTSDHPIYSWSKCGELNKLHNCPSYKNSYRSLDDGLTVGDRVFVLNRFSRYGDVDDIELAKLLGYIGTDGYVRYNGGSSFCNIRRAYIDEFEACLKKRFPKDHYIIRERPAHEYNGMQKQTSWTVEVSDGEFAALLRAIGAVRDREAAILDYAFKFSEEALRVFVNRCWSGDGCVYTHNNGVTELSLHSGNKAYLEKYRLLLRKLGIINSKVYEKSDSNAVKLTIKTVDDILNFFDEVGQIYGKEIESLSAINEANNRVRRTRRRFGTSSRQKIVSIDYIGDEEVYDITVEDRHNFFANGAVVHNCTAQKKLVRAGRRTGKTSAICILTLWAIFTHIDYTVLVIAPYQAQVTKIFDEMERLIATNPDLSSAIRRKTKNPQRIELNNGSKVLGFSSGSKSASKSDKIRGQDAHYIVLDEADYLDDADLEAILAILASHPNCGLWASSTPKGAHNKFYQWACDKNLAFKEFHYISAESPSWTEDTEEFFLTNWGSVAFEHEFWAEFGIQEGGVFRNDLIDKALAEYSLPQPRSSPHSRIVAGVDWNGEKNGVHIIVTEFWNGKYRVLAKEIVKDAQFTQHAAIDRILELNHKYDLDFVYVDEGYGRVQVEIMHKIGMQQPATGLHKKVVAYSMNKQIEMRDPVTGSIIKKPPKPFMVNLTALQLEEGRLQLPVSEDTQILVASKEGEAQGKSQGLVQQMRNYTVERISVLGLPTYSQGEDHTLTAFMLSIIGFIMQFSDMAKVNVSHAMRALNSPLVQEKSPENTGTAKLAAITRQLDTGFKLRKGHNDLGSIFKARQAQENVRGAITRGERAAIQRHFGKHNINRKTDLGRGGRGSF